MKTLYENIRQRYFEILLKIGGLKYRYKNATAKFMKSQEVSYKFNKDVAENYRYYEDVNISISNYGNGPHELHLMSREQLMTSLGHCYATLRHIHAKYIDISMSETHRKMNLDQDDNEEDEGILF
jgi:N-acetylneuraminic acid mutarotase